VCIEAPDICRNLSRGSPLWDNSLPKPEIFKFWGHVPTPRAPTEVKFCTAKWTQVPLGHCKFHVNQCNESPLQGKNADFQPLSKFSTGSLPLCGNPARKNVEIFW